MDQFPSNSHRPLASPLGKNEAPQIKPEVKLDPVVTGKVVKRKKPLGIRIKEALFSGDSDSVFGYLGKQVLLPAFQNLVIDFVTQGIEKAVYGPEARPPRSNFRGGPTVSRTQVNYSSMSTRPAATRPPMGNQRPSAAPDFDIEYIVVEDMAQAQAILDGLYATCEQYKCATVANLKELLNETAFFTDHKWGWTDLSRMTARRVAGGFLLVLPEPEDLT